MKIEPTLPKGWSDFKIVETISGSFTGLVYLNNDNKSKKWNERTRLKLRRYTKKYLESLIGYKIKKHTKGNKK